MIISKIQKVYSQCQLALLHSSYKNNDIGWHSWFIKAFRQSLTVEWALETTTRISWIWPDLWWINIFPSITLSSTLPLHNYLLMVKKLCRLSELCLLQNLEHVLGWIKFVPTYLSQTIFVLKFCLTFEFNWLRDLVWIFSGHESHGDACVSKRS